MIKSMTAFSSVEKHQDKMNIQVEIRSYNSRHLDLILGGHTHTFLEEPVAVKNMDGNPVIINQAGWAGVWLGKLNIYFGKDYKGHCESCKNYAIG